MGKHASIMTEDSKINVIDQITLNYPTMPALNIENPKDKLEKR